MEWKRGWIQEGQLKYFQELSVLWFGDVIGKVGLKNDIKGNLKVELEEFDSSINYL